MESEDIEASRAVNNLPVRDGGGGVAEGVDGDSEAFSTINPSNGVISIEPLAYITSSRLTIEIRRNCNAASLLPLSPLVKGLLLLDPLLVRLSAFSQDESTWPAYIAGVIPLDCIKCSLSDCVVLSRRASASA